MYAQVNDYSDLTDDELRFLLDNLDSFTPEEAAEVDLITDELEKVKAENTRINALIKSGAAGAAGGNPAVTPPAGSTSDPKAKTKAEFDAMNPREKSEFSRNGGRITD